MPLPCLSHASFCDSLRWDGWVPRVALSPLSPKFPTRSFAETIEIPWVVAIVHRYNAVHVCLVGVGVRNSSVCFVLVRQDHVERSWCVWAAGISCISGPSWFCCCLCSTTTSCSSLLHRQLRLCSPGRSPGKHLSEAPGFLRRSRSSGHSCFTEEQDYPMYIGLVYPVMQAFPNSGDADNLCGGRVSFLDVFMTQGAVSSTQTRACTHAFHLSSLSQNHRKKCPRLGLLFSSFPCRMVSGSPRFLYVVRAVPSHVLTLTMVALHRLGSVPGLVRTCAAMTDDGLRAHVDVPAAVKRQQTLQVANPEKIRSFCPSGHDLFGCHPAGRTPSCAPRDECLLCGSERINTRQLPLGGVTVRSDFLVLL